jgi:hypothetical protein
MLCRAAFTCQNFMKLLLTNYTLGPVAEKVVGWSISHHLQNTLEPVLRNGKLIISAERLVRLLLVFIYDRWMYICGSFTYGWSGVC